MGCPYREDYIDCRPARFGPVWRVLRKLLKGGHNCNLLARELGLICCPCSWMKLSKSPSTLFSTGLTWLSGTRAAALYNLLISLSKGMGEIGTSTTGLCVGTAQAQNYTTSTLPSKVGVTACDKIWVSLAELLLDAVGMGIFLNIGIYSSSSYSGSLHKENDETLCFRSTGCPGNSVSACRISLLNCVYINTSRFHQCKEDS